MVPTVCLVTLPSDCAAWRISALTSPASATFCAIGAIASSIARRSFMSISGRPMSSATRNATLSTPSCTSLRSSIRDSSSGPISETVARTGWPCSPNTSQNTVVNWSGWNFSPISWARLRMKSLASPTSAMPDRSPLISAANTGTPARAKPSAITCSDTVLPVPVAPVTRPWRLASANVNHAGCSPLPIKILSSVSPLAMPLAAISSFPRTEHSNRRSIARRNTHPANHNGTIQRRSRRDVGAIFTLPRANDARCVASRCLSSISRVVAFAMLQHLRSEMPPSRRLDDEGRLCFVAERIRMILEHGPVIRTGVAGALWTS